MGGHISWRRPPRDRRRGSYLCVSGAAGASGSTYATACSSRRPGIIGLLWFYAYPIAASLFYSFTNYDGLHTLSWAGLSNYVNLAQDSVFWQSLYNTAYFVVFSVPLNPRTAFLAWPCCSISAGIGGWLSSAPSSSSPPSCR